MNIEIMEQMKKKLRSLESMTPAEAKHIAKLGTVYYTNKFSKEEKKSLSFDVNKSSTREGCLCVMVNTLIFVFITKEFDIHIKYSSKGFNSMELYNQAKIFKYLTKQAFI